MKDEEKKTAEEVAEEIKEENLEEVAEQSEAESGETETEQNTEIVEEAEPEDEGSTDYNKRLDDIESIIDSKFAELKAKIDSILDRLRAEKVEDAPKEKSEEEIREEVIEKLKANINI